MKEIFFESFYSSNIIATGFLLFAVAYWFIVLLGMIDMDSLDVDVDLDADLDIDADADVDVDNSGSTGISWFNNVLIFFNLHNVPLMIFYSFLVLPLWVITVSINHYLGITSLSFSLIVLVPTFFFSLFVAKFATVPIAKMFANVEQNTENTNPVGKVCLVALPIKPSKIGQGIINDLNGNVVRITIIGQKNQSIKKGEKALVIEYLESEKAYLVEPYT